jgi:two-component system, cell cycle sensor histidine kinase and response regulator CckA
MHSLLNRQLRRHFKDPAAIPKEFETFLQVVDDAYCQSDADREMLERALDLSSNELLEANAGLREKEERIRSLINAMPDIVCFKDGEGRWLEANAYDLALFQLQGVPYQGRNSTELAELAPSYRETFITCEQSDERAWQTGTISRGEEILPGRDGKPLVFDIIKVPLFHTDGSRKGLVVIGRDITERKRIENALRDSELRYRAIFDAAGSAMVIIGKDMTIKLINARMERLSGYAKRELEGRMRLSDLIIPDDREALLRLPAAGEEGRSEQERLELRLRNLQGENRDVFLTFSPIPGSDNFVAALVDITNHKRLESQLLQAQKMEAIGTLAGGIAHDFNNLLMGIQGYVSLMLCYMDEGHPDYSKLQSIEEQVRSGAGLTRQLLGFARRGRYEPKPTHLNEILNRTTAMFGRTRKEMVIHAQHAPDLWTAEVDQGQIEQVMLNLLVNAWQAMPGGGRLFLSTENVILSEEFTRSHRCEHGKYVCMSVTDTGVGMDVKTMERIFDPFFTTKEMGHGTGLGLASAYGIVKTHGGMITVESEKGCGSTFRIYLPASEKSIETKPKLPQEIRKGQGTILLVDDEQIVIDVNVRILSMLGYDVLSAANAREALSLYEQKSDGIDLVLLDMIMPDMGGGETFDALKKINPEVKVILTSGYTLDGQAHEIMERGCRAFIQKPFTIQNLSQKIHDVLTSSPKSP